MKNLHLLNTEKPSRLIYINFFNELRLLTEPIKNNYKKHIYITNNKQGFKNDYVIHTPTGQILKVKEHVRKADFDKIILTTDQDLINDGIQAIDNEFLEWFVKNPNCDRIEVESINIGNGKLGYIICKPKEEPKQTVKKRVVCTNNNCQGECVECNFMKVININEPEQETLEEAAEKYSRTCPNAWSIDAFAKEGSIEGIKWQQKRMHSDEEVLDILKNYDREFKLDTFSYTKSCSFTVEEWFKQYKKNINI